MVSPYYLQQISILRLISIQIFFSVHGSLVDYDTIWLLSATHLLPMARLTIPEIRIFGFVRRVVGAQRYTNQSTVISSFPCRSINIRT